VANGRKSSMRRYDVYARRHIVVFTLFARLQRVNPPFSAFSLSFFDVVFSTLFGPLSARIAMRFPGIEPGAGR
jgi:hypothetical protein